MDAEIVAIGSELLLGTTVDTNSATIAQRLAAHGVNVFRKTTVGDNTARIAAAVSTALERADLVVCTGGLGPTVDDVTREGVAAALGRPLELRQELLEQIAARFAAFKRPMSTSNRRQAYVPTGARAIENPRGTAPAFLIEDPRGTVVVLPGVPGEMRYLLDNAVLPYLRNERGITDVIVVRVLHATGMGESVIGERIDDLMQGTNPTVGISAKRARYELRIGAKAANPAAAEALIAPVVQKIQERLGDNLIGSEHLEEQIGRILTERKLTLATYEGHIAAPIFQAIQGGGIPADRLRGVMVHPADQPSDEEAARALAFAGADSVRHRWRSDIALGLQTVLTPEPSGATVVCLALTAPGHVSYATHRYDVSNDEGWGIIGSLALGWLRRYLLDQAPSA